MCNTHCIRVGDNMYSMVYIVKQWSTFVIKLNMTKPGDSIKPKHQPFIKIITVMSPDSLLLCHDEIA